MGEKIYALKEKDFNTFMSAPMDCKLDLLEQLVWEPCNSLGDMLVKIDRDEVEDDPTIKQIIPYIVITDDNYNILTYTREGSEKRLIGQKSIGFGGHWKAGERFIECIKRELNEELGIRLSDVYGVAVKDIIYSEATPVDSVHMGILIVLDSESEEFLNGRYADDEVKDVRLISIEDINPDDLETWSRIAYEKLLIEKSFSDTIYN